MGIITLTPDEHDVEINELCTATMMVTTDSDIFLRNSQVDSYTLVLLFSNTDSPSYPLPGLRRVNKSASGRVDNIDRDRLRDSVCASKSGCSTCDDLIYL